MTGLVPLFPLPNMVMLPRVVVPLHLFEDRYKALAEDAIAGEGLIAMALLRPGWEKGYHGAPPIMPVVCVGEILQHERLADGRFNILLQGRDRVRVVREERIGLYRAAEVEALEGPQVLEIDLLPQRQKLVDLLTGPLRQVQLAAQFAELLGTVVPTSDAADVMAFHLIDDVREKQLLLEESDARERVMHLLARLEAQAKELGAGDQSSQSKDSMGGPISLN